MPEQDHGYRALGRQKDMLDAETEAEFFCANCKAWLDPAVTMWVPKIWHEGADDLIEDMYCDDCIVVEGTRSQKSPPPSE
jgi:hypothetical protein